MSLNVIYFYFLIHVRLMGCCLESCLLKVGAFVGLGKAIFVGPFVWTLAGCFFKSELLVMTT